MRAALHISPVYLNEVVKNVTGESVGRYIRNEIVLRAKRMLVYTTHNIGEIACELGFDDYAYFTRLFTKQTGMNPHRLSEKIPRIVQIPPRGVHCPFARQAVILQSKKR